MQQEDEGGEGKRRERSAVHGKCFKEETPTRKTTSFGGLSSGGYGLGKGDVVIGRLQTTLSDLVAGVSTFLPQRNVEKPPTSKPPLQLRT